MSTLQTWTNRNVPAPGSHEAISRGCTCFSLTAEGALARAAARQTYLIEWDCPLHRRDEEADGGRHAT